MTLSRRQTLSFLRSAALVTAGSLLLPACATTGRKGAGLRTACLLPLSGRAGEIGQSMARAIQLAQPNGAADGWLTILDTRGTPEGCAAAATSALAGDPQLIIGPLFAAELVAAIPVVADRAPIIAFTNDPGLVGQGAFIFGITPSQTVSAIVQYAVSQGKSRIAVVARPTPWGEGALAAARASAQGSGLSIVAALQRESGEGLIEALKAESGGAPPDAVLLPDGLEAVNAFAPALHEAGIQLLGTVQWSGLDLAANAAMDGAWFAAPDPSAFSAFAAAFARTYNAPPGLLAGLAFDAAMVAGSLGPSGDRARDALVASAGYAGVTGAFKFNGDGSCLRRLAILAVEPAGIAVVAPVSAA